MDWFNDIYFSAPAWFYSLPIVLILLGAIIYRSQQPLPSLAKWLNHFSHNVYRHPLAGSLVTDSESVSKKSHRPYYSIIPYLLISSLLALCLAQPYKIGKKLPEPPQHRDIVFLVDTSVSMILRDYLVNGERIQRITVLKNVLTHFIDQLKGNRIRLIAFSEKAYTLVPLTTDYNLLKHQLQRLEAASLTGRSSDLSNALLYALKDYAQDGSSKLNKPVFVMLSDANRPIRKIDPKIAAEYVAQHNIRLHTIAIGAGSYEAEDLDKTSLVYHPTSFYLLEQIAKSTQGKFFWAKDSTSLAQALKTINETEKRNTEAEVRYIQHPLYMWPLLLALLCLAMLYLLSISQRWRRH